MSVALRLGCIAGLGMVVTVYAWLSLLQSRPSPSAVVANAVTRLAAAVPPALHQPPERRIQSRVVSIPPVPPALIVVMAPGLPVVVTPTSAGGPPSRRPINVRQPRMPADPLPGVLLLPAGSGPFPAVILLHGCNGPFHGVPPWANRLNAWGYAVIMPDSMTPRGETNVCAAVDQPRVTAWDRAGDVSAAAAWLRTQLEIDPARIAVLGLSHGGATAAIAAQAPYAATRLRAAVDYYGPCVEPRLHGSVPLLVLAGEADDWGEPAARCRAYGNALRPDQPFEIHTYPDVYHAFDGGPETKTLVAGHVLQFDREAAEDSFIRVRTFLDRLVRF